MVNNSILQQMLVELANLDRGQTVNPQSAKQIFDLLYQGKNGSSSNCTHIGGATDKNTLLSI